MLRAEWGSDVSSETEVLPPPAERRTTLPGLALVAAVARRHWLFLVLFAAGAVLRVVTQFAYRPALLNSAEYLVSSKDLRPRTVHPVAYPVFLRILPLDHGLTIVSAVQHVLGLGIAVLIYALLLRLGLRAWIAALGAAPALLDAYQLGIEQYITPETIFELFLVGGCAAILWKRPAPTLLLAAAGLLFAFATITRTIGVFVLIPAALTVIFLRVGWSRAGVFVLCFLAPLTSYAVWYHSYHDKYAITGSTGKFLYARVVPFVDCDKFELPSYERVLCPKEPPGERLPVNELLWSAQYSPLPKIVPPPGMTRDNVAADFAKRVIIHQPGAYARDVGADVLRAFEPVRHLAPGEYGEPPWEFHSGYPTFFRGSICSPDSFRDVREDLTIRGREIAANRELGCELRKNRMARSIRAHGEEPATNSTLIAFLRGYQRVGYAPGPLLAACLFAGFAAALGLGRARGSGLRSAAFLFAGAGTVVCLGSIFVAVFSWRYEVPQLALLPAAGALGITALLGLRENSATAFEVAPASAETD
jgi:hypothetical protein